MASNVVLLVQILDLIPEHIINNLAAKFRTKHNASKLTPRAHLATLLVSQICQVDSLRALESIMQTSCADLSNVGVDFTPSKSTIAYQNKHQDWRFFEALYHALCPPFRTAYAS